MASRSATVAEGCGAAVCATGIVVGIRLQLDIPAAMLSAAQFIIRMADLPVWVAQRLTQGKPKSTPAALPRAHAYV